MSPPDSGSMLVSAAAVHAGNGARAFDQPVGRAGAATSRSRYCARGGATTRSAAIAVEPQVDVLQRDQRADEQRGAHDEDEREARFRRRRDRAAQPARSPWPRVRRRAGRRLNVRARTPRSPARYPRCRGREQRHERGEREHEAHRRGRREAAAPTPAPARRVPRTRPPGEDDAGGAGRHRRGAALSVSNCRTICPRPAPSAVRMVISRARSAARASSRLVTLAQAMRQHERDGDRQHQQRLPDVADHDLRAAAITATRARSHSRVFASRAGWRSRPCRPAPARTSRPA